MNGKQKMILWVGIIVVVLMGLFPPTVGSYTPVTLNNTNGYYFKLRPSYGFLLSSLSAKPTGELHPVGTSFVRGSGRKWISVIDFQRLLIHWFIVSAITAGAIVSIRKTDAKPKE